VTRGRAELGRARVSSRMGPFDCSSVFLLLGHTRGIWQAVQDGLLYGPRVRAGIILQSKNRPTAGIPGRTRNIISPMVPWDTAGFATRSGWRVMARAARHGLYDQRIHLSRPGPAGALRRWREIAAPQRTPVTQPAPVPRRAVLPSGGMCSSGSPSSSSDGARPADLWPPSAADAVLCGFAGLVRCIGGGTMRCRHLCGVLSSLTGSLAGRPRARRDRVVPGIARQLV